MRLLARTAQLCLAVVVAACSKSTIKPSTPYRAQVLSFSSSNSADSGEWTVREQTLATLEAPDTLRGQNFEILAGRNLTIDFSVGSLVSGKITGTSGVNPIRYDVQDGVIVPRDTTTLLMYSGFYSFEQIFNQLSTVTGMSIESLRESVGRRFEILFEPTFTLSTSNDESQVSLKMNAAFNSQSDSFILFRRSNLEKVPLSANLKVLSHEFGHALFKQSFFKKENDACFVASESDSAERLKNKFFTGRLAAEYAISGMNEGYADFNSFVITGETNPLAGSFSDVDISSRSLKGEQFTFPQLLQRDVCSGQFYCIGTLFARALYKTSLRYPFKSDDFYGFSRRVFQALVQTRQFLAEEPSLSLLPFPSRDVSRCVRRESIDLGYDGAVAGAFLAAFLRSFPSGQDKATLCEQFAVLFGQPGFPPEARSVCEF